MSSTAGFQALPYNAGYGAAKSCVLLLSEAVHAEVEEHGVTVTVVCPGPVRSGFQEASEATYFAERLPKFTFVSPDRVARDALAAADRGKVSVIPGPPGQGGAGAESQDAEMARPAGQQQTDGRVMGWCRPSCEDAGMDTSTIDQAYQQLQTEFQDVANSIQTLAQKLQAASQAGDSNARDWLLDLKQVALDVKDEQMQVNNLLQTIHAWVDNSRQQFQQQYQQMPQPVQQQVPAMYGGGGGRGGLLGGFLNSGFGRAMEMGAGIGLGEDLINSIF
jgi:short chain dehydrogenase